MRRGSSRRSLIAETQGNDTSESAARVAVIMRANGLRSCIAVSDAYHVFRIRKLLEHEGIGPVYTAPRWIPGRIAFCSAPSLRCGSRSAICYGGSESLKSVYMTPDSMHGRHFIVGDLASYRARYWRRSSGITAVS